jgi:hypothetical protein
MKILYAILNWGLGHASRSSVVIDALLARGIEVEPVSDGQALEWIKRRFPNLNCHEIKGLNPEYPANGSMVFSMMKQLPGFIWAISREHAAFEKLAEERSADAVISDNRYGCYAGKLPSVFLGHQLQIQLPAGSGWMSPAVQFVNRHYLSPFNEIWIPDHSDRELSGDLSTGFEGRARFLGRLSHLKISNSETQTKKKYLFLLSGPEPQRSLLERKISRWPGLKAAECSLVRGTSSKRMQVYPMGMEVHDLADSETIARLLASHEMLVCRPGYSTLCDLWQSNSKALLIPTPGQTEQEYLGSRMQNIGLAMSVQQDLFKPDKNLTEALEFKGFPAVSFDRMLLDQAIDGLIKKIK